MAGISNPTTRVRSTVTLDVAAFVEHESPTLLTYFARRTATLDDAADLLGDTLLIVWRRERTIPEEPTQARMWLYGVARKVLAGHRRSSSRRAALSERLRMELSALGGYPPESDPIFDLVRGLISDLPAVDREIIELVYWEGFSLVEVAQILSMKANTVRSRHSRACAKLRAVLATEEVDLR